MFASGILSLLLVAVATVNGSPMPYGKREPFSFTLPNRLPISGAFNGFNITEDANGNSVINFGSLLDSLFGGGGFGGLAGSSNTTSSGAFPFNFLNFKRDQKLEARDPFSFTLPNGLPISGDFGGFNITQDANGHSIIDFGSLFDRLGLGSLFGSGSSSTSNTSTSTSSFPFSFLNNLKRDEKLVARDPFSFTLPNRLPISGAFNGFNITEDANGHSIIDFGNLFENLFGGLGGSSSTGNTSTSSSSFPFSFLNNLKRDEKLVARDPFSFTLPNRLPISGLFNGFNVTEDANGHSVIDFGNLFSSLGLGGLLGGSSSSSANTTTTSSSSFPFSFLDFKRDFKREL